MSEEEVTHKGFAQKAFAFDQEQRAFEEALSEAGVEYDEIGWDWYDSSLELYGVVPNFRLSEDAQRIIYEANFTIVYVNHTDKWETHYSWSHKEEFKSKPGWRIKYGHKSDPPVDYHEVESFPDSWPKQWLKDGDVRVKG